jgi:hypothetical protein
VAIALFAAVPAQAVVVPGCFNGDFTLFGKSFLDFEAGATDLFGDVILLNPNGLVKVGASNRIHGTIFANSIQLGTGSVVDKCVANSISGAGTCTDKSDVGPGKFAPTAACDFPPSSLLPIPSIPAVCTPRTVVSINAPGAPLAPGCYASVRVQKGATATLEAGKTVFVKGEFRQITQSSIVSDTPGSTASLVVGGAFLTEAAVNITDVNVTDLASPGNNVHIGNGSIVTNSPSSPTGRLHSHGLGAAATPNRGHRPNRADPQHTRDATLRMPQRLRDRKRPPAT